MKYCDQCGAQLDDEDKFCSACGNPLEISEKNVSDYFSNDLPRDKGAFEEERSGCNNEISKKETEVTTDRRGLHILIIIFGAFFWMGAPFIAITRAQQREQPSALQIVVGDMTLIGKASETMAFWMAIGAAIGIVICMICLCRESRKGARITAIIVDLWLSVAIAGYLDWASNAEEFFGTFGFGFWAIYVLFVYIACIRGKQNQS